MCKRHEQIIIVDNASFKLHSVFTKKDFICQIYFAICPKKVYKIAKNNLLNA